MIAFYYVDLFILLLPDWSGILWILLFVHVQIRFVNMFKGDLSPLIWYE